MTYPPSTVSIAAFLKRRWSHCRYWPRESLLSWVQWFINHDRCLLVTEHGKIASVGLVRRVTDTKEIHDHYGDSNGPVLYVDVCVSRHPGGMRAAFSLALRKWGRALTHICWVRGKYDNRFTLFTINDASRHLIYG